MGAQGLDLKHGHDALLADTEFDFIEETLRCLRDTGLREKLVREGQKTVTERLSWDGLGARLRKIYAERFGITCAVRASSANPKRRGARALQDLAELPRA
jgi:hypothetical protein